MPFQVGFLPRIFQLTWSLQRTRTDRIPLNKTGKYLFSPSQPSLFPAPAFKENSSLIKFALSGSSVSEQITPGMGKSCRGMPAPKYPHSTGIQKDLYSGFFPFGSKFKTGWWTNAWTCPQPDFLLVSHYYEDHHRCQHSRWTDALTVDSGHVQSQPCLSGGSPPGGRPVPDMHCTPSLQISPPNLCRLF